MKKKLMTAAVALLTMTSVFAQSSKTDEVTSKNSWLKVGLEASVPVGDVSDVSSFAGGIVLSGQWMANPHFGLGVSSGYTNFFAKDNFKDFGVVPIGALIRYYPKASGVFIGTDLGYSFITNTSSNKDGGFYFKPQVGYHNYSWNFYAFYNQVVLGDNANVQNAGVGAIYNLRFKK